MVGFSTEGPLVLRFSLYNLVEAYAQQHAGEQNDTLILLIIRKYKFSSVGTQSPVHLLYCSGGNLLHTLHFINMFSFLQKCC